MARSRLMRTKYEHLDDVEVAGQLKAEVVP